MQNKAGSFPLVGTKMFGKKEAARLRGGAEPPVKERWAAAAGPPPVRGQDAYFGGWGAQRLYRQFYPLVRKVLAESRMGICLA
ncbi:hypothetical protein NDU88_004864 [Pleurodeles waltl]|uniref:Uncharacterized protein n=1 Tax=Pleurodeles waltl TaxID=8319 RepID=A0AAV7LL26_PLEWA|nr:hypothetical protein NDU88_004864 [Pleurodeles waltl]